MIEVTAKRRTTLNGKTYAKGDTVPMTAGQFEELKVLDRFERTPAKKSTPETKPITADASKASD